MSKGYWPDERQEDINIRVEHTMTDMAADIRWLKIGVVAILAAVLGSPWMHSFVGYIGSLAPLP